MKYDLDFIKNHTEGWFFPSDVIPHSRGFKYACQKFYRLGFLERRGNKSDRWGYQYKVSVNPPSIENKEEIGDG